MSASTGLPLALAFLRDLAANNDRAWLEANRPRYEAARAAFEDVVARLIAGIGRFEELGGIGPADCVFRINRDVRFSADKSPYKTQFGALIGPAGRKSGILSYYVHLEPGGASMVAGGLHHPEPRQLAAFREAVTRDAGPLKALLEAKPFRERFGEVAGERLKTAPRGYPKDHPELGLLRLTQVMALRAITDEEIGDPGLVERALGDFKVMRPLLLYLEEVCGGG